MEITKDEIVTSIHDSYSEFELCQFIVKLAVGDTLEISVNGQSIKTFIAKYINCHFNMDIQDKGEKRDPTELESLIIQRDKLNEQIAKEETK